MQEFCAYLINNVQIHKILVLPLVLLHLKLHPPPRSLTLNADSFTEELVQGQHTRVLSSLIVQVFL